MLESLSKFSLQSLTILSQEDLQDTSSKLQVIQLEAKPVFMSVLTLCSSLVSCSIIKSQPCILVQECCSLCLSPGLQNLHGTTSSGRYVFLKWHPTHETCFVLFVVCRNCKCLHKDEHFQSLLKRQMICQDGLKQLLSPLESHVLCIFHLCLGFAWCFLEHLVSSKYLPCAKYKNFTCFPYLKARKLLSCIPLALLPAPHHLSAGMCVFPPTPTPLVTIKHLKHSQASIMAVILLQLNVLPVSRARVYPQIFVHHNDYVQCLRLVVYPILLFHAQWYPQYFVVHIFTNLHILLHGKFTCKNFLPVLIRSPQRVYQILFINSVPGFAINIYLNVCLARNTMMFAMSATSTLSKEPPTTQTIF